ncbi:tyrosine-type recombinase/integrase [Dactylosporangium sp. NPDC006015]|uniref:tyrosine-type recombinase/integrase n=1 Tax=Dactylosporangium sp. NPDC006015 TaxID=3154576 RepID=UPI0033BC9887
MPAVVAAFLHHISKGAPVARRTIALKVPRKLPRVLTTAEVQAILDACEHLRDRLLFAVLYDSGCRIGEALGLRHEDLAAAERELTICRRDNDNGARSDEERRRQAATEQARAACLEAQRAEHFHEQVRRWRLVPQAAAFLDALRAEVADRAAAGDDVAAAQQWLTWAEQYVAGLDPLRGDLRLPDITEPTLQRLQTFLRDTGRP